MKTMNLELKKVVLGFTAAMFLLLLVGTSPNVVAREMVGVGQDLSLEVVEAEDTSVTRQLAGNVSSARAVTNGNPVFSSHIAPIHWVSYSLDFWTNDNANRQVITQFQQLRNGAWTNVGPQAVYSVAQGGHRQRRNRGTLHVTPQRHGAFRLNIRTSAGSIFAQGSVPFS